MNKTTYIILVFCAFTFVRGQSFNDFLSQLEQSDINARPALVDSFMNAGHSFPLIEDTLAHFIYFGDASTIHVPGDFNGWEPNEHIMDRVEGTDFLYLTMQFETDARLDYKFVRNMSQWILDPLNPNTCSGGYGPNSELAMEEYIQPIEIQYNGSIPHGQVESFTFQSTILNNSRTIYVYTPPNYEDFPNRHFPVMIVNDGGEYLNLGKMDHILDYLISEETIVDMVVVFVNPVNRNEEYFMNPDYAQCVVSEIVPHIQENYRTLDGSNHWGIMGASLGGLISVYISHLYPNIFGLCGSHSGYFPEEIQSLVSSNPNVGTQFYLDWGTYEQTILETNIALLSVLQDKEYSIETREYHEGHSWGSWRAHTDNILTLFFPRGTVDIQKKRIKVPNHISINSIFPNPFNPTTTIQIDLVETWHVGIPFESGATSLHIYDITGRLVETLVNKKMNPGKHVIQWNASQYSSGVYYIQLKSNNRVDYKKVLFLK